MTGMSTCLVTTEIRSNDTSPSFVRGVNKGWVFMTMRAPKVATEVSPLGRGPPQQPPSAGAQWNARQLAGCSLWRDDQVHLKGAPATRHTPKGGSRALGPAHQVRSV